MIRKKQDYQADRKVNPLIGVLLFFISLFLLLLTGPIGFVYGLFHALLHRGLKGLGEYLLKIAISIDQLGNVLMQYLLNVIWIKKGGYPFGNRDETISSALGRNKQLGMLTGFGQVIDAFLDLIDPNHSLNSIDYYIEPSRAMKDRVCWIFIQNNRVLFVREKGSTGYVLPGGDTRAGEADAAVLAEAIHTLFGIRLELDGLAPFGIFESRRPNGTPGSFLRQRCYMAPFSGNLQARKEETELHWFGYESLGLLPEPVLPILDSLRQKGFLT